MTSKVIVAGVGMIPFTKPGKSEDYDVMGAEAARRALADAGVAYRPVQQAYAGYVYGDSTCGQHALYDLGLTGIPSSTSTTTARPARSALCLARQAVEGGAAECVLALGFEQMEQGALGAKWNDRPTRSTSFDDVMNELQGVEPRRPLAAQMFGGAGREYTREVRHEARDVRARSR